LAPKAGRFVLAAVVAAVVDPTFEAVVGLRAAVAGRLVSVTAATVGVWRTVAWA
jgi:hypothetical protein